MKIKMGRPAIVPGEQKDILIGARFSPHEAERVQAAVRLAKVKKSEWIRKILLKASENP